MHQRSDACSDGNLGNNPSTGLAMLGIRTAHGSTLLQQHPGRSKGGHVPGACWWRTIVVKRDSKRGVCYIVYSCSYRDMSEVLVNGQPVWRSLR